jgi:hypothetical protein
MNIVERVSPVTPNRETKTEGFVTLATCNMTRWPAVALKKRRASWSGFVVAMLTGGPSIAMSPTASDTSLICRLRVPVVEPSMPIVYVPVEGSRTLSKPTVPEEQLLEVTEEPLGANR